jgi:5-deoxy-5-amino-3-dehydroquinate synthase
MVTDVAGFAAASWHRGVAVVHVSTTLVGMVDAAIGGKTGVNLAAVDGVGGKNLIGAFWQPSGVVCDLDALSTLPPREVRCGRGEMAKYHFLTGDDLLAMDDDERIARCVEIKAEIVPATNAKAARGRCSTTATRWRTRWRSRPTTAGARRGRRVGLDLRRHLRHVSAHRRARVASTTTSSAAATSSTRRLPRGRPAAADRADGRDKKALGDGLTFVLDGRRRRGRQPAMPTAEPRAMSRDDAVTAAVTTPALTTERLLMREWRDSDRAPYAEINGDPEVMRHFPSTLTRSRATR